jgi:hypothetical protein|tara:strand:- start:4931 stop:5554 length:624 start_codon:yes stop_codon:yes gene_type:complete
MARSLTTSLKTALIGQQVTPIMLFFADFPSGAVRAWTGYGDLAWDSQIWSGVGDFGGVDRVEEVSDQSAKGVVFSLTGIPSSLITIALADSYQGRACSLYLGALDSSGVIIADPYLLFLGRMDVMEIEDGGETATIRLTGESRLIDLNRARSRRYTNEDQQIDYVGDVGLEYVSGLQDKQLYWGVAGKNNLSASTAGSSTSNPKDYL